MPTNFALIQAFHQRFPHAQGPLAEALEIRKNIMTEEMREVAEALTELATATKATEQQAKAHVAKELTDLLYAIYGTLHYLNIDADAAFAEVHRSNMTKTPNPQGGKAIKGETYTPANMEQFV